MSGKTPSGRLFGAVFDGCSQAGPYTDVGARSLGFAVRDWLFGLDSAEDFDYGGEESLADLERRFSAASITGDPLDGFATALCFVTDGGKISTFAFGDGAFVMRLRDGRMRIRRFDWEGNIPYYLNYRLLPKMRRAFLEYDGRTSKPLKVTDLEYESLGGVLTLVGERSESFGMDEAELGMRWSFDAQSEEIETFSVMSDGVSQFLGATEAEAAWRMTSFKNANGAFVKRRMLRALEDWGKAGVKPQDDVSIASAAF